MSPEEGQAQALFKPIHRAHAIAEMVIYCELAPELDLVTTKRLISLKDELKDKFPISDVIQQTQFRLDFNKTENVLGDFKEVGVDLKRLSTGGNELEWMMRLTSSSISIHCLNYSRWEYIWEQSRQLLQKALRQIGASSSVIAGIGLKYIDRFEYIGSKNAYKASLLFKTGSKYLTKQVLHSDPRWHCHSGWFMAIPNQEYECLNQLNVDSAYAFEPTGNRKHFTTIEHNLVTRGKEVGAIPTFGDDSDKLNELMEFLHRENKRVLADLIVEPMAKSIKLNVQEEVETCSRP